MTKELQDLAWSCLPKEFKEEVKKEYAKYVTIEMNDSPNLPAYVVESAISRKALLEMLFGIHNLISDAEGEEMLTVSRKRIQDIYTQCEKIEMDDSPNLSAETVDAASTKMALLSSLFGSKCLPDNVATSEPNVDSSVGSVESLEPKPAEPKFHRGDAVIYQGIVYTIYDGDGAYILKNVLGYLKDGAVLEQDLEPYNGPKYHIGDKVRYLGQNREIGEIAAYYEDEPGRYSVLFGKEYHNIRESDLEPYTEPTEPKHHKGEKVYLRSLGLVEITDVVSENDKSFSYGGADKRGTYVRFVDKDIMGTVGIEIHDIQEEYVTVCNP